MTITSVTFQANIGHMPGSSVPDEYDPSVGRIPPDDFVITRDKNGIVLSRYGDVTWNRTPYAPGGRTDTLNFNFWGKEEPTPEQRQLAQEMRWLMFLLIYLRRGPSLSNGSLSNYQKACWAIARFCELRSIRMHALLGSPQYLTEFMETAGQRNVLGLVSILKSVGSSIVGFDVVNRRKVEEFKKISRRWAEKGKQHPPIPTRIYSAVLSGLVQELADFGCVMDRLLALFFECANDPLTGMTPEGQIFARKRLRLDDKSHRPNFPDLLLKYDLEHFWEVKGFFRSRKGLSSAITQALATASFQIQAFTGMRINEVQMLPLYCLYTVIRNESGRAHYIVKGRATKLTNGKMKRVQWVTSNNGRDAILLAQRIAEAIYKACGEAPTHSDDLVSTHHLFITPSYALDAGGNKKRNIWSSITLRNHPELRARLQPIIEEEDLHELEQIDPHRAWRTEEQFQIGQPWTLTSHQLRRSLALYAQRSGLVSLQSLKRQLQHITQEMSTYYARGSLFAKNFIGEGNEEKHFGQEWQEAQPVSQYLSYAAHVLFADKSDLFGVHPHWLKHRLRNENGVVMLDRDETLKRFKKGEMAYQDTILGGCVNVGECHKSPLDLLHVECITEHCKNMVGNKKKLERVIVIQSNLVKKLQKYDPKSSEFRHEKYNLEVLEDTLENLSNPAVASKMAA